MCSLLIQSSDSVALIDNKIFVCFHVCAIHLGMRPDTLTNGQGERLKTAIFPESHPDLSTVSSPSDNQTNMQRLIGSSHMVKQSITNLLQYKVVF